MRALILFLILALNLATEAQPPDTLCTRTFGGNNDENGYIVQQTTDGGYVIIGTTESYGAGDDDIWLIKTDSNGDSLWTRTIGGPGDDTGFSGEQTNDGGYIITGHNHNFGIEEPNVLLVKTNSQGDTSWTRTYGGVGEDFGRWVQQTIDGGYIIAGQTTNEYYNLWIIKTDAIGDTQWTRTYGRQSIGIGYCVQQTSDSGYIFTGQSVDWSSIWLLKINSSGDSLWTRFFEGPGWNSGYCVQQTTDGGYIIAGTTLSYSSGPNDIWLIKTDSNGDSLWTRFFGGSEYESGKSVQQTSDGGYIITGTSLSYGAGRSDIWLIKTDPNGDSLWTCILGINDYNIGNSAQQTYDDGYIVAGSIWDSTGYNSDICLIRLNSETSIRPDPHSSIPHQFTLFPPYPNPFNASTVLTYSLPHTGRIALTIHNILGQRITTLFDGLQTSGIHTILWNPENLSSGVYFCQLESENFLQSRKILLVK